MPQLTPNLKHQIIDLAERIKDGTATDLEIHTFMTEKRDQLMKEAVLLERGEEMPATAFMFSSCSCGSREDSCSEDGIGNFSRFYGTTAGDLFRVKFEKE